MANAIARALENTDIVEEHVVETASNPLANLWLGVLAVCLVGTLLCTAVLVAWPIIANLIAG